MDWHAQLKFVMAECSKTQIRLTGLNIIMFDSPGSNQHQHLQNGMYVPSIYSKTVKLHVLHCLEPYNICPNVQSYTMIRSVLMTNRVDDRLV